MIHPADRERVERIMSGQVVDEAEFRIVWPDGSVHWILGKGKAFLDQSGRPIRMVGVLMDITERKRLEERLREADKLESLGVLAAGLAHDFNNLLTAILGFTTLSREQLPAGSTVGGYLKAIEAAGQEAARLTAQVLAYSGKGLSAVRPVDLSALAAEMAAQIRSSLPGDISLELDLAPGLPAIDADVKQLQQAFLNLTGNAAEAIGGAAGVIRISTSVREIDGARIQRELAGSEIAPGPRVCLEVRDNGCGMDEETRAQVFDPFYSTKFLGRGLGLAAVAGIARGHGAAIQVESAPGRGSTFRLLFRPSNNSAAQRKPERPAAARTEPAARASVLLVDGEAVLRQFGLEALGAQGYEAVGAATVDEAISALKSNPGRFAVVVFDAQTPGAEGVRAIERLREAQPGIALVIAGDYNPAGMAEHAAPPASGYLRKPYTSAELAAAVAEAARRGP
jgi:signal transduction histidine kinase/CheY-like chemotaxis protein